MATDTTHSTDAANEQDAPGERVVELGEVARRGPFTLASLLDLNDDELAQPLLRNAPTEQHWEQLSLAVTPETGAAVPAELRTVTASQVPLDERELIPGLDAPGAVEVPVYLAGRTISKLLREEDTSRAPPRVRPPAISVTAVGRPKKKTTAPVANFAKAAELPMFWPKGTDQKHAAAAPTGILPQECAQCGSPSKGERCTVCGHEIAVRARVAHPWGHFVAAFLDSDSRVVRTAGALVLTPGELTHAVLTGHRRRYVAPLIVATAALILFALVSALGGLRPRPDRTLMIGTDRTSEAMAGLVDRRLTNLAVDAPPDFIRDVATTMDYVPLLWFPLMAFGVIAITAALRTFQTREPQAEVVFTAHFTAWFALWWGVAVPLMLVVLKFGFEYSAAWDGVGRVRYVDNGQIDGLSPTWNAFRAGVVSPAFHSLLIGLGVAPWAVVAWHRAFETSWIRAAIAGLLTTLVPLVLLIPFA